MSMGVNAWGYGCAMQISLVALEAEQYPAGMSNSVWSTRHVLWHLSQKVATSTSHLKVLLHFVAWHTLVKLLCA